MAPAGEFDHIVTRAGSAGCAMAARSIQSGQYRVLLLEAGPPDRNPWIDLPMGFPHPFADPAVNWMYGERAGTATRGTVDVFASGQSTGPAPDRSTAWVICVAIARITWVGRTNITVWADNPTVTDQPNRYELAEKAIATMLEDARATA